MLAARIIHCEIFTMSTTMLLRSGLLPAKLAGQALPAKPQRCSLTVRAEGEKEGKDDQKASVQKVSRRRGKGFQRWTRSEMPLNCGGGVWIVEHLSFHHPQTDALAFNVAPDGDWAYLLVGDKLIEWFRRMQGLGVITQYSNALQACKLHLELCSLLLNLTGRYLP